MKNSNTNVMACGACAVIVDENGEMITSIDLLVDGVKKLFAKRPGRTSARRAATRVHA